MVKIAERAVTLSNPGHRTACSQCNLQELCLPVGLSETELAIVDKLVGGRRKVARGQALFHSGEPFTAIYAVKLGFFKTEILATDGRHQVTGFHMAGEVLGMDGISTEMYNCDAIALEDSEVCLIPFSELEQISGQVPTLQRHLHRVMSREIVRDQGMMIMMGAMSAEERVVSFLLNLSQRYAARGYAATEFHLRMTREEIGAYLGLKLETVSRAFSRLQEEGLIAVEKKHIRLLDASRLRQLLAQASACN
ncbi:MAG: fumarate/nitrate reduction transcriptional regulator Fnr [Rugosibacter sp.]